MSRRGDVVVRVRQIAEDRAAGAAGAAALAAAAARDQADEARRRASVHPLATQGSAMSGDDVMVALGVAAALRESVLHADARVGTADDHLATARRAAEIARAERKAAERIAERRRAAFLAEMARRDQRTLDEAALALREMR